MQTPTPSSETCRPSTPPPLPFVFPPDPPSLLPPGTDPPPPVWNDLNEKQLRSALIGACKRMPRNASAHLHLALMYMRKGDNEEAFRSFQHCYQILKDRIPQYQSLEMPVPMRFHKEMAMLKSHMVQTAHKVGVGVENVDRKMTFLRCLQSDLIEVAGLDKEMLEVWNVLSLMFLNEKGFQEAKHILDYLRRVIPEYNDGLNNLGLAELAMGNELRAIQCFQKVLLCDREHSESLANYALVMLKHGMCAAAIRAYEAAVEGSKGDGRGLAFAWGGLAVARGAVGMLTEALEAAEEAERTADPANKANFAMLVTSMKARLLTKQLRNVGEVAIKKEELIDDGRGMAVGEDEDPRTEMDITVLRLRSLTREIQSSAASTALGTVLRLRHEHSWEDSGNRNFGAESAERLVEALEKDVNDVTAWVQLGLLQMGTGEYQSARDFAAQGLSRDVTFESGWNLLGVASQLSEDGEDSMRAYEKAIEHVRMKYNKNLKKLLLGLGSSSDGGGGMRDGEMRTPEPDAGISGEEDGGQHVEGWEDWMSEINETGKQALAVIYNNIGNLRRQEGRSFRDVLKAYNLSLHFGGENADVYNNLALLYISVDSLKEAGEMLEHALKLDPQLECAISNQHKLSSLVRRREREREEEFEDDEFISLSGPGEEEI